jgi:hypothetical protein
LGESRLSTGDYDLRDAIASQGVADGPDRYEPRLKKRRRNHYDWLTIVRSCVGLKLARLVLTIFRTCWQLTGEKRQFRYLNEPANTPRKWSTAPICRSTRPIRNEADGLFSPP